VDRARLLAEGVGKMFGATTILDSVDLAVAAGEIVALTGENGAGKTTLMRICAGVLKPDSGTVRADSPIEHLVMFGRAAGLSRTESIDRGHRILAEFGYPTRERAAIRDLSGGTRQKLNLTIALLAQPPVLLLDEPYQGFDRGTYVNFWDHCRTWRSQGMAVVVVTHMLAELDRVDRVVELPAHPSRVRKGDDR
jgi:ABC-2 type transport system ATP-binding protein